MRNYNYLSYVTIICFLVLIAGCQDSQVVGTETLSGLETAEALGVSAPGTVVFGSGTFVSIGGASTIRESGPGINEAGDQIGNCETGGAWRNPSGNLSASVPHSHCSTTAQSSQVIVTFSQNANLVHAKNGNINLNFQDVDDAYIHYQVRQNRTNGDGFIIANGDDNSEWIVSLSQATRTGNWFNNNPLALTAYNGDDEVQLTISW